MSRIVALDVSLTSTGFASSMAGTLQGFNLILGKGTGEERMISNLDLIMKQVDDCMPDFVVIEEVAYSMNKSYAKENSGMHWAVRMELCRDKIPRVVVASTSLKKWCTGSGAAPKELVIKEVLKRWGADCPNNDTADAVGMLYLGMALVEEWTPTLQQQREVLAGISAKNPWLRKLSKPLVAEEESLLSTW